MPKMSNTAPAGWLMPVLALVLLPACDDPRRPPMKDPAYTPAPPVAQPLSNAEMAIRILPPERRIAMMQGQVAAARAIASLGEEAAAADLLHQASTGLQPEEMDALAGLGFQEGPFLAARVALEATDGSADPVAALDQLDAHLRTLETAAGADPREIMRFLMELSEESYAHGVRDGEIVRASQYQTAYGHVLTVQQMAARLDSAEVTDLLLELRLLLMMWPDDGPSPTALPAPEYMVSAQIGRVLFELALLE